MQLQFPQNSAEDEAIQAEFIQALEQLNDVILDSDDENYGQEGNPELTQDSNDSLSEFTNQQHNNIVINLYESEFQNMDDDDLSIGTEIEENNNSEDWEPGLWEPSDTPGVWSIWNDAEQVWNLWVNEDEEEFNNIPSILPTNLPAISADSENMPTMAWDSENDTENDSDYNPELSDIDSETEDEETETDNMTDGEEESENDDWTESETEEEENDDWNYEISPQSPMLAGE